MRAYKQQTLTGIEPSVRALVEAMPMENRVERAVKLLQLHEPQEGYYQAFSGGKDSCVCKKLCQLAGVRFESWYNNVTIDPPELVRFIKTEHPDVQWNQPRYGNMLYRVSTRPGLPPTRSVRWCCDEYKEQGGRGRVKVIGVRAAESKARAGRWTEVTRDGNHDAIVCPIVYWTDEQVWEFIRFYQIPYCSLYDEGFKRLGCIGCPLAGQEGQDRDFRRWPRYEELWKRAVIANWRRFKDTFNSRTGNPRFHAQFGSGEEFWTWWRRPRRPRSGTCQGKFMWTND